ncbi:hypothetical protein EfmJHP36_24910 [Enterococcus faecium]|nr:hypothetical protein EfmJHP36_24910 [Enterococcus faecium]
MILKIRLMNGFNPYPKIFSNQLPLIVEKNSLIGKTALVVLIFHQGKEVFRQARFIDFKKIRYLLDELTAEDDSLSYEEIFRTK